MRKPIIIGNWKMNNTLSEAIDLVNGIKSFELDKNVEKVVCVPYIYAMEMKNILKDTDVKVGVQNVYFEEKGAYTGEVSSAMLNSIGAEYVIVGHSERRTIFGETDDIVNKKVISCLKNEIIPILCCGETLEERKSEKAKAVIENQIRLALKDISKDEVKNVIIAYEPIWAIGTGITASSKDAEEIISFIRTILNEMYAETSEIIRIQYGGSVKPENVKEIMAEKNIDGALVGGACLKAESYRDLVNFNL